MFITDKKETLKVVRRNNNILQCNKTIQLKKRQPKVGCEKKTIFVQDYKFMLIFKNMARVLKSSLQLILLAN